MIAMRANYVQFPLNNSPDCDLQKKCNPRHVATQQPTQNKHVQQCLNVKILLKHTGSHTFIIAVLFVLQSTNVTVTKTHLPISV